MREVCLLASSYIALQKPLAWVHAHHYQVASNDRDASSWVSNWWTIGEMKLSYSAPFTWNTAWLDLDTFSQQDDYRNFLKEHPWEVYLTCSPNREMGALVSVSAFKAERVLTTVYVAASVHASEPCHLHHWSHEHCHFFLYACCQVQGCCYLSCHLEMHDEVPYVRMIGGPVYHHLHR